MRKRPVPVGSVHLIDEDQLADLLAVSVKSVQRWRLLRKGPPWRKISGSSAVRYDMDEVATYLRNCPGGGEREPGGKRRAG